MTGPPHPDSVGRRPDETEMVLADVGVLRVARFHHLRLAGETDLSHATVHCGTAQRLVRLGHALLIEQTKRSNAYGGEVHRYLCITAAGRAAIDAVDHDPTIPASGKDATIWSTLMSPTVTVDGFTIPRALPPVDQLKSLGLYLLLAHAKHHGVAAGPETPKAEIVRRLDASRTTPGVPPADVGRRTTLPGEAARPPHPNSNGVAPTKAPSPVAPAPTPTRTTSPVAQLTGIPATAANDETLDRWLSYLHSGLTHNLTQLEQELRTVIAEQNRTIHMLTAKLEHMEVVQGDQETRITGLERRLSILLEQVIALSPDDDGSGGESPGGGEGGETWAQTVMRRMQLPAVGPIVSPETTAPSSTSSAPPKDETPKPKAQLPAKLVEYNRIRGILKELKLNPNGTLEELQARLAEAQAKAATQVNGSVAVKAPAMTAPPVKAPAVVPPAPAPAPTAKAPAVAACSVAAPVSSGHDSVVAPVAPVAPTTPAPSPEPGRSAPRPVLQATGGTPRVTADDAEWHRLSKLCGQMGLPTGGTLQGLKARLLQAGVVV